MDEAEMIERLTKTEERTKSNTHRLDKLEPVIDELHALSQTMVRLVEEVRHTNESLDSLEEKVDRMDSRVDDMERAPANEVKEYKKTLITAIISTIGGAIATGMIIYLAQFS